MTAPQDPRAAMTWLEMTFKYKFIITPRKWTVKRFDQVVGEDTLWEDARDAPPPSTFDALAEDNMRQAVAFAMKHAEENFSR